MNRTATFFLVTLGCAYGGFGCQSNASAPRTAAVPESNELMEIEPVRPLSSTPDKGAPAPKPTGEAVFANSKAAVSKLGFTPYPGSVVDAQAAQDSYKNEAGEYRLNVVLRHKDPVDKVAAYYEKALSATKSSKDNGYDIMGRSKSGTFILMSVTKEGSETVTRVRGIAND